MFSLPLTFFSFVCICLGVATGGFELVLSSFVHFFEFGNVVPDRSLITCLQIVPAAVVIGYFLAISGVGFKKIMGIKHSVDMSMLDSIKKGSLFGFVVSILLVEEIPFRFLPIWLGNNFGWNIPILLLVFNVGFAAIHIFNFKDETNLLITVPQFLAGLLICAIAYQYGVWTALIVHLYYDLFLFSEDRDQNYNIIDILLVVLQSTVALIGYSLCSDILNQFVMSLDWNMNLNTLQSLDLNFANCLGLTMLFSGAAKAFGYLIGLNPIKAEINDSTIQQEPAKKLFTILFLAILGFFVGVPLSMFINWVMSKFFSDSLVMIAILAALVLGSTGLSSLSKGTFAALKLPGTIVDLILYCVVPFPIVVSMIAMEVILSIPDAILLELND
jgi:Type II CAAX prenyl endopeptidase Rce1-like